MPLLKQYQFPNTYRLKEIDACYLLWGEQSISRYLDYILRVQPPFILGLEIYFGPEKTKIRLETKCHNRFRNHLIAPDSPSEITIDPFLKPSVNAVLAESIGTSYCNLVSFKIMNLITGKKIKHSLHFFAPPQNPIRQFSRFGNRFHA